MLHAAGTWAMKADTLNHLRRNDRAMIRWICNVKAKDEVSSDFLLTKFGIQDLDVVLRTSRMRWFGHAQRSTGWISEVRRLNVVAQKRSFLSFFIQFNVPFKIISLISRRANR